MAKTRKPKYRMSDAMVTELDRRRNARDKRAEDILADWISSGGGPTETARIILADPDYFRLILREGVEEHGALMKHLEESGKLEAALRDRREGRGGPAHDVAYAWAKKDFAGATEELQKLDAWLEENLDPLDDF